MWIIYVAVTLGVAGYLCYYLVQRVRELDREIENITRR